MKIINLFGVIAIGIVVITQTSCGPKEENGSRSSEQLKFVFITACAGEDFFIPVKKGMDQAASLLGVECSFTGTEEVDPEQQAAMVEEAVKQRVDGIALSIIDTIAFDYVVEKAMENGIPVVAFNVDDNKTPNARLSGTCQNLYKAGYDMGIRISPQIPENSTILMTMHSEGISALDDRIQGQLDALQKKNIKGKILITGTDPDTAKVLITRALKENHEIMTILCTGQADTEGAGLAIEENFSNQRYVAAGFDLSPEILRLIKKGHILFTVDQQPFMQGFYPVVQLYQYCSYGILPSNNEIVASFVDRNNADAIEKLCNEHFR
jgi:simple sugar transport system substrate-binding protein